MIVQGHLGAAFLLQPCRDKRVGVVQQNGSCRQWSAADRGGPLEQLDGQAVPARQPQHQHLQVRREGSQSAPSPPPHPLWGASQQARRILGGGGDALHRQRTAAGRVLSSRLSRQPASAMHSAPPGSIGAVATHLDRGQDLLSVVTRRAQHTVLRGHNGSAARPASCEHMAEAGGLHPPGVVDRLAVRVLQLGPLLRDGSGLPLYPLLLQPLGPLVFGLGRLECEHVGRRVLRPD